VQPSGRSGLTTPESIPPGLPGRKGGANDTVCSGDQPFGQASRAGMVSMAELFDGSASLPPAAVAVFVISSAAVPAMFTTIVIGG
jgi:hypothetical protein